MVDHQVGESLAINEHDPLLEETTGQR
jgi:hypothetical protein